ncbi:lecithin retinol acyltransferase family protein [Paraburkholderia sp. BL25I1N1]|uniref:lecithin retinol acyltransferase family protein n=1 Tax=Paraburkholderia sp. BL25I1N1 TaxID=1938804 RepID=UPI000D052513|nr:lecithin retinol acyltransferase family protein [Paraburkholderia sp. BL25I1N1]PRY04248.1 lecithin:retinol acyltransferase [Paraburkholderia sp. BL25I1N1]
MASRQFNGRLDRTFVRVGSERVRSSTLPTDIEPDEGSHIIARRSAYDHHGIYVGNGTVVHYAGLCRSLHRGPVEETTIECFASGHEIAVKPNPMARYVGAEAVRRARSRLGENRYRLLRNNCEHFCNWCLYGESRSEQVEACFAHPMLALRAVTGLFLQIFTLKLHGMRCIARAM